MNEITRKIKRYCRFGKLKYIRFERSYLKNKNKNTNRKFLLRGLVGSLILLIGVMLFPPVEYILMYLTGTNDKLELLEFIGLGMSGIIAVFGVVGLLQRAAALDEQNKITEKGHVHERFKVATEHLGNESVSVRIAAFNEFCHLAEIEPDWQKNILDILCAHIRQTTKDANYKGSKGELNTAEHEKIKPTNEYYQEKKENLYTFYTLGHEKIRPTEEIRTLLTILFRKPIKPDLMFNMIADLAEANLQGAFLSGARMKKAYLYKANLQYAYMPYIDLQEAKLAYINMQKTNMCNANLQKANMCNASLKNALMLDVNLQSAILREADLQAAYMSMTNLQGADLQYANLQKTILQQSNMQYANLQYADLQGADLQGADLQYANLKNTKLREVNLQRANLQSAIINQNTITTIPDDWKDMVMKNKDGKTGVFLVDDEEKIIERL